MKQPVKNSAALRRREPREFRFLAWLGGEVATLNPGYFALVMATGIISNAMFFTGHRGTSNVLFAVNTAFLLWLVTATLWRVLRYRAELWRDLVDPRRVFSFFTIVAALDVFGGGLCLRGQGEIAVFIWCVAFALWFVLLYFSFGVLAIINKEGEANAIHGGWLIAIVGTESLVILGSQISPWLGGHAASMSVLTHMLWGVGLGLYGIFITLFAHRMFFFRVEPSDLSPLLWVVMGAGAIATNAGSVLILTETTVPFLQSVRPFIDGATLLMWAWTAWLIPLLALLDIWKYAVRRLPLVYVPMQWSFVFPLGMFALASGRLSLASDFTPLAAIAYTMVWIALLAWLVTASGLAMTLWRSFSAARLKAQRAH